MTTILPTLELKYNKETTSSSTNTNTNNNIKPTSENIMDCPIEIPPEISTNMTVKKSDTPQNISEFKEALIAVLITYFKNNVVLLNNLTELSDNIITKIDDLRLLIFNSKILFLKNYKMTTILPTLELKYNKETT
jgi:hypothetical protein